MPATTRRLTHSTPSRAVEKGDNVFNSRDFATVDTVHHPNMIAYITGLAEPIYGSEAHRRRCSSSSAASPTCTRNSLPDPVRER